MLFYVIFGVLLLVGIISAVYSIKNKEKLKEKNKLFPVSVILSVVSLIAIVVVIIISVSCQNATTVESIEKDRVYLVHKVQSNEYDSNIIREIEQYNSGIEKAKKNIKNPFLGIFYTKAEAEAKPIVYTVQITE